MLERSQSLLQYYNNIASLQDWYSADHGSLTPQQDEGDEPMIDLVMGLQPHYTHREHRYRQTRYDHRDSGRRKQEHRNRQLSSLIENIETDAQAE